ncbi:MAG TPA: sulfurtransferase-like selenium metabolism protein YedF [Geobacteraceae bacterium]|nr:sulfurtransferase-like selenium metabolism protein YedF [Geobacteraceae bacterium]
MKIIDCRNMACPMPVVTVKKALEEGAGESIKVLLDDGPPRENVARFAANRGYLVEESQVEGGGYCLIISGHPGGLQETGNERSGDSVLLVASDRLGDGPDDLGRLLMKNFIITLLDADRVPERMLFVNSGVFLTTEGSEVIEALEKLGNRGTEILSCGMCLDYFNRRDKLKAGSITNMLAIVESLLKGGTVVRL